MLLPSWHNPETDRIVGGDKATEGLIPYQVSLQIKRTSGKYSHFCGGSYIGDGYVLTAAYEKSPLNYLPVNLDNKAKR
jgi:secreted trypsin-like serine protease